MVQIYGSKAMPYKLKSMNKGFFPDEHSEISRYSHEIYRITSSHHRIISFPSTNPESLLVVVLLWMEQEVGREQRVLPRSFCSVGSCL